MPRVLSATRDQVPEGAADIRGILIWVGVLCYCWGCGDIRTLAAARDYVHGSAVAGVYDNVHGPCYITRGHWNHVVLSQHHVSLALI